MDGTNVTFVTYYEKMVTNFESWLEKFAAPFQLSGSKTIVSAVAVKYKNEFQVSDERIGNHKRKITLGDHKEKLKPDTIDM